MKSIILKKFGISNSLPIVDSFINELEEQDMPGISLGYLFKFRDETEKNMDNKFKLDCRYDLNGKCNVIHESLSTLAYLTLQITELNKEDKKLAETILFYSHHIYNILNSEFKKQTDKYLIDLDKWEIQPL